MVVPLLLTAAYHSKTDIPARLAAAAAARPGLDVACAGTLGDVATADAAGDVLGRLGVGALCHSPIR